MDRKNSSTGGLFGSLKHKLSRKGSKDGGPATTATSSRGLGTPASSQASNPFLQATTPTRRPGSSNMASSSAPSGPPPAYATAITPQATSAAGDDNDPYAFLAQFDTVFLIDDSGSMAGRSWRETQKALEAITPICTSHDADGIDIYFLNEQDNPWYHNVRTSSTVAEIFSAVRPKGSTPLGQRLNKILKPYLSRCEANLDLTKPMNIIVITDGEPSDDPEGVIIQSAKKLDAMDAPAWQVGVQFFQVGKEAGAKEYLQSLDDNLGGGQNIRDMVDTQPWTNDNEEELNADGIMKTVLGAVNRRLDRKSDADLYGPVKSVKKRFW